MNTRERYIALMTGQDVDRTLLWELGYWVGAVRRWYREGLPEIKGVPEGAPDGASAWGECAGTPILKYTDQDVHDYFEMDQAMVRIPLNIGTYPPFEEKIVEKHAGWYIWQTEEGLLRKERNDRDTLPSFVGSPVSTREDWERYKTERLRPDIAGRLPNDWPKLVEKYKRRDYPLALGQIHGFFGTPRNLLGVEGLLTMYYDDPALMKDINNHLASFWISLFDDVLRDVSVDAVYIWEDMCYKGGPLISPDMFREFILPGYQKLTNFLKEYGVKIINVDSDGDVWKLIPLWIEGGVNVLYPFEVVAGMDVVEVRETFPNLGIMGGIDKRAIAQGREAIDRELEGVPFMLKHGGFIPTIDHMVSPDISFENFSYYRQRLQQMIEKG